MKKFRKSLLALIVGVTITGMTGFAGVSSAAQSSSSYTVHYGDTLWKIAALNQVGLSEIIKANPQISNPAMIYPGQVLNIPNLDSVKSFEAQVIQLTNTERAKQGLSPLHANWELSRMARYKSQDMMNKDYFDHNSPTYGSPFDMMKEFGISFSYAGENIAAGQTTPAQVVNGWMNSPGHRANILNPNYTQIGVGFAKGGSYGYYWTQEFISN